ncbi:MAG: hypothetical protein QNK18_01860 [Gammaproteobacteria bacterium]|nr:hypothetical protein [Gammaproteobacteria bacterium]MDJ0889929.1 hypothetical protein [Gammaproteobacteria bacterium]
MTLTSRIQARNDGLRRSRGDGRRVVGFTGVHCYAQVQSTDTHGWDTGALTGEFLSELVGEPSAGFGIRAGDPQVETADV